MNDATPQQATPQARSAALEAVLAEFKRLQNQIARLDAKVERLWTHIGRRQSVPSAGAPVSRQPQDSQKTLPFNEGGARRVTPFPRRPDGTNWIVPPFPSRR